MNSLKRTSGGSLIGLHVTENLLSIEDLLSSEGLSKVSCPDFLFLEDLKRRLSSRKKVSYHRRHE